MGEGLSWDVCSNASGVNLHCYICPCRAPSSQIPQTPFSSFPLHPKLVLVRWSQPSNVLRTTSHQASTTSSPDAQAWWGCSLSNAPADPGHLAHRCCTLGLQAGQLALLLFLERGDSSLCSIYRTICLQSILLLCRGGAGGGHLRGRVPPWTQVLCAVEPSLDSVTAGPQQGSQDEDVTHRRQGTNDQRRHQQVSRSPYLLCLLAAPCSRAVDLLPLCSVCLVGNS